MSAVRTASCVWRISDALIAALDERLGDPLDAYVNGSQTWLLENGPGGVLLEWRLHPVAGYERPATMGTYDVFPVTAAAIVAGDAPAVPAAALWDGLEAFAAHGDEVEPAPLRAACVEALGLEPDACGLVDHDSIGDAWERTGGAVSVISALLDQLEA
jgi:hypothetical protein